MNSVPSKEDVLDAFAAEPSHDALIFKRYLMDYPQYAEALVDLSRELSREIANEPLTERESAWIEETVRDYCRDPAPAPFASPTVERQRTAAVELKVPRQVITAILERKVDVRTIPSRTRRRLAHLFEATAESLLQALSGPPASALRSYKADGRPSVSAQVGFEQVLREAKVSEGVIADLLSED